MEPIILARDLRGVDDIQAALRASAHEIQAALRASAHELKIVFDARCRRGAPDGRDNSLDAVAAAKLLAPVPLKSFGRTSLGPMLTALGCELWLVVDHHALAQITSRIERNPHRNGNANGRVPTMRGRRKRRYPKLGPEWGRLMRARGVLLIPEGERRRIAQRAARARWGNPIIAAKDNPAQEQHHAV